MKNNPLTDEQQAEIDAIRSTSFQTLRPTVPELEKILYTPLPVLDHGFIRVVDYMGDDAAIVQAARVSYGKGTKRTRDDSGLINYLMRNWHTSPFEMCEIKLHVKLPIFIARQWIRHRTANVNEYSARYSVLDNEFYVPDAQQLRAQSSNNRQGRGDLLEVDQANRILSILQEDALNSYTHYEEMLNENFSGETIDENKTGLARELARMNLSLGFYTQWYWKIDLHNLMHFLRLRADAHAQWEIREYADVMIEQILKPWLPITYGAFLNYRLGGMQLSEQQLSIVKRLVSGENVQHSHEDISATEWRELMQNLEIKD
ncbi:MAG: thymidylate synthase (FAD) [Chloroflexi bacterium]|nr:thymidylate synthase (FAD) [Chloroflexota bacterium]MCH2524237.1 FAD-dependent thymidylate synthase [Dehalococcoidia bacterium]|tara:strand:+ start:6016 stop:6966 length:951 start_codon:yes stop_codon:yes gene_type:complete